MPSRGWRKPGKRGRLPGAHRRSCEACVKLMMTHMMDTPGQVTVMLREMAAGDSGAVERLMPLVYDELRGLAG